MVKTVGISLILRQKGRKDYDLLNAERMVYISFVINAFKKVFVLLMLIKRLCIYIYFLFIIINFWGVFLYDVGSSNVERLGL